MQDRIGIDFSSSGSVMNKKQLEEQRRKRGECLSCGQKCFQKKLFKMVPLTIHGSAFEGRCLKCRPLDAPTTDTVLPAVSRPATRQDMQRFSQSQSSLRSQSRRLISQPPPASRDPARHSIAIPPQSRSRRSTSDQANRSGVTNRSYNSDSAGRLSEDEGLENHRGLSNNNRGSTSSQDSRSDKFTPLNSTTQDSRPNKFSPPNSTSGPTRTSSLGPSKQAFGQPAPKRSISHLGVNAMNAEMAGRTAEHHEEDPPKSNGDDGHGFGKLVIAEVAANRIQRKFRDDHPIKPQTTNQENSPVYADYDQNLSTESDPHDRLSGSAHSTRSGRTDDDEINNHEPIHGVLNRGGEIQFNDTTVPLADETAGNGSDLPFRVANAESSRTMSSMSSIEEDRDSSKSNETRQLSWKPAKDFAKKKREGDVFEGDDDDLSIDSETGSCRSKENGSIYSRSSRRSSTQSTRHAHHEERAVADIVAANDNYQTVLSIMRENPTSSAVQQEGLKHISEMRLSDNQYSEIMEFGALRDVMKAMKTHLNNPDVQCCGCRAIWNLSATPQNQILLVDEGALECILVAMESFPNESQLQEKALSALSNLGAAAENQERILRLGTIERIVEAMNKHSENGIVQAKACSALTNFASYDSPLKRKIMEKSGGGAVVVSMIMHPEDIDLQEKALRALRNICANCDENKIEVANVGGIDAVISAMQVHRDESGVQEAGAWTLSNLAVNPDNKALIGDSGGIDVVIRAMWVHSDNDSVQEWCCRALWTLSVDAQNRLVMMEIGGISAVVNAMQAHVSAATVQEKGCGVLSNLAATNDDSKVKIVEEEALDAIIMAMVIHGDNRAVQDRACSVLKRLAIGPNIKPMQAANVGELVIQAAEKFPEKCREKANAILKVL
mmetsp:Transcript_17439/g.20120  ORF Transcript_17439/g.20120 Transcript_17439/m.20120 type:complete len:895 (+) Transcript_17439:291-2975(+)|eukprot:CAMPEP_0194154392 /NCGR_PEP_ID=MMETSP0152-20130528/60459_1 /TAXON_ID=1049557 /ORGANISM="Thalassiothrix antarctica, Strain L6-D1" /LENGTH=894 /DNA_ID=CAMNT_0038860451 /DNA_START=211 /DNA_END=2895 /DNA_ORIENTATION=+